MNIVLTTDFSKRSKRAADAAAGLAGRLNGRILLVHPIPKWTVGLFREDLRDEVRATIGWRLRAETARLAEAGVAVSGRAVAGRPPKVVIDAARDFGAEVIIVGPRGNLLFAPWQTRLAKQLMMESTVPVLAIREPEAFETWMTGERPLKVVLGYDFSRSAEAALRWVSGLSKAGEIDLTLAYISWPPEEAARYGINVLDVIENPPDVERFLERELKYKCARHGIADVRIRTVSTWGRKDFQLLAVAAGENADLIVTGTAQRGIISRIREGSVSRGVARAWPSNLVSVPSSYARRIVAAEKQTMSFRGAEKRRRTTKPELAVDDRDVAGALGIPHGAQLSWKRRSCQPRYIEEGQNSERERHKPATFN